VSFGEWLAKWLAASTELGEARSPQLKAGAKVDYRIRTNPSRSRKAILTGNASRESSMGKSVMLIPVSEDGRLILHLRDDRPGVLHPAHWAGFGGAIEAGESFEEALQREVLEETGVAITEAEFVTEVTDEVSEDGGGDLVRIYVSFDKIRLSEIDLGEGAGVASFTFEELDSVMLSPFVRRALTLCRDRFVIPSRQVDSK
jgi:8-oxo-dGTP diphosphatase